MVFVDNAWALSVREGTICLYFLEEDQSELISRQILEKGLLFLFLSHARVSRISRYLASQLAEERHHSHSAGHTDRVSGIQRTSYLCS